MMETVTDLRNHTIWTPGVINASSLSHNRTCDLTDTAFTFVINGITIGLLCVFGFIGNTLSIFILQKDPNNKVAIFLLQSLAVADNLLLVVSFFTLCIWKGVLPFMLDDMQKIQSSMVYIPIFINPLGAMTQTITVWLTVLLALNRFIAICKPFQAQVLSTLKKAKIQVICVVVFGVCFNLPMFFQNKIITIYTEQINSTTPQDYVLDIEPTSIGYNTMFGIVYTNALYSILVLLLPLLLLMGLNCRLVSELQIIKRREQNAAAESQGPKSDSNITIIMIIIIVIFIICQTPDRILQVLILFSQDSCSIIKERLKCLCNLLIVINSSTNFVIYYMFRKSFRKILRQKIGLMNCFRENVMDAENNQNGFTKTHVMALLS